MSGNEDISRGPAFYEKHVSLVLSVVGGASGLSALVKDVIMPCLGSCFSIWAL